MRIRELPSIEALNPEDFEGKVIILDLDGTIVADGAAVPTEMVRGKITALCQRNTVYLATNSRNQERNQVLAKACASPLITTPHRKPSPRVLDGIETNGNVVVIGDKFLTDGLFAKRVSGEFIKVSHLRSSADSVVVRLSYWLDDVAFGLFKAFRRR